MSKMFKVVSDDSVSQSTWSSLPYRAVNIAIAGAVFLTWAYSDSTDNSEFMLDMTIHLYEAFAPSNLITSTASLGINGLRVGQIAHTCLTDTSAFTSTVNTVDMAVHLGIFAKQSLLILTNHMEEPDAPAARKAN